MTLPLPRNGEEAFIFSIPSVFRNGMMISLLDYKNDRRSILEAGKNMIQERCKMNVFH